MDCLGIAIGNLLPIAYDNIAHPLTAEGSENTQSMLYSGA